MQQFFRDDLKVSNKKDLYLLTHSNKIWQSSGIATFVNDNEISELETGILKLHVKNSANDETIILKLNSVEGKTTAECLYDPIKTKLVEKLTVYGNWNTHIKKDRFL